MAVKAILTCDIVNSTKLSKAKEIKLMSILKEIHTSQKIEFFRGDSFQVFIKNPLLALELALLSRLAALKLFKEQKLKIADVRISIGIGEVKQPIRVLSTAKGEAFLLSGRTFDAMAKTNQRLAITINNPLANEGLQIIVDFLNHLFDKISGKQAEVLFELLQGQTQVAIAKKLKKTKSTIHQLATAAQWIHIEKLLQQYDNIIKLV
jgi:hypothetical protein